MQYIIHSTYYYILFILVARTCGDHYSNSGCKNSQKVRALLVKKDVWACSCKGDKCNTGTSLIKTVGLPTIIVAAILSLLFM